MNRNSWLFAVGLGLAASLLPGGEVKAADHRDGVSTLTDPSTDINDVYAWMSADKSKVYLVMTVFPAADKVNSKFSNSGYYVFHTTSRATFAGTATPFDIICGFDTAQKISCWLGDSTNFLSGDASPVAGLTGTGVKVFAGVRKDHFFFNLDGFNRARNLVKANVGALTFNANRCPTAPAAALNGVAQSLALNSVGANPPVDFFKTLNTLSIVMEVDTALLTKGGSILSVWAGTYRKG